MKSFAGKEIKNLRTVRVACLLISLSCLPSACRTTNVRETNRIKAVDAPISGVNGPIRAGLGVLDLGDHKCNAVLITPNTINVIGRCLNGEMKKFSGFVFKTLKGDVAKVSAAYSYLATNDLVVYQLDRPLSGHLLPEDEAKQGDRIRVAGVDLKSGKDFQVGCSVEAKLHDYSALVYSCDSALPVDATGAAIFLEDQLVGLHMGFYKSSAKYSGLDFGNIDGEIGLMKLDGFSFDEPKPPLSKK